MKATGILGRPVEWIRSRRALAPLLVAALVSLTYLTGALQFLDFRMMDLAFKASRRPASGSVVIVAIDPESLQRIGVWPWPRRYHSVTLQRLLDAGASKVALALDLSSRTTPEEDATLAAVLRSAGGSVVLPVFRQAARDGQGAQIVDTAPLPAFESDPTLASANMVPSSDARIRSTNLWVDHAGLKVPTFAAALAALPTTAQREFLIDYGIDPRTIPLLSYIDARDGRFDRAAIEGRSVIIAATAIELGTNLPVPLYQTLPGAVIQALAFESLVQDRAIQAVHPALLLGGTLLLTLVLVPAFARWSWRFGLVACLATAAAILGTALALHHFAAVLLPPTPLLLVCILGYAVAVLGHLDREARRVYLAAMAAAHKGALARRLVDHSFDAIFVVGHGGMLQAFNPAAERMFGYDRERAKSLSVMDLFDASGDAKAALLSPGGNASVAAGIRELTARRRDGRTFPVEVSVTVVPLRSGRHKLERRRGERTAVICTARDITERKAMEAALRRAHSEAEEASRAKTELIANMSHELRTPLNAIIGFSDMMEQRVFGELGHPRYADYARQIGDSGKLLLRIISDILDLSSLEARRFILTEGPVDIAETLRHCMRQFDTEASAGGITFQVDLPSGLPNLRADEAALRQAMCNLISNAVKFNREGGTVRVSAAATEDAMTIVVADTGIGIPEDQIERLLEPFERLEGSLARRFAGTGLGLPLARSLLALHGSALTLESEPDAGTTARVRFTRDRFWQPEKTSVREDLAKEKLGAL